MSRIVRHFKEKFQLSAFHKPILLYSQGEVGRNKCKSENIMLYRPDIDGLRALAILSVIVFHAFPQFLNGGFVGVDIFFFISGYLISSIILNGLKQETFKFRKFYYSRVKRILPALLIVLLTCAFISWLSFFPIEYKQLGKHITGGLGFVDNFLTYREIGYFDLNSEFKPLLHLWSLSIEEQFYIVFPFVICFFYKFNFKYVFSFIALIMSASFVANIILVNHNINGAFFFPQTRAWELLVGSLFAYARFFYHKYDLRLGSGQLVTNYIRSVLLLIKKTQRIPHLIDVFSVLGLFFLVASICFIRQDMLFPGYWPLLPLLGTALLVTAGPAAMCNRYILSHPFMVGIGLISYPLYLWHWPVLSFIKIIHAKQLSITLSLCAIFLSFILAWLTYFFIEKPIRFGKNTKLAAIALCCIVCITGYLGLMMFYGKIHPRSVGIGAISENLVMAIREWEYPAGLKPYVINDEQMANRIGGNQYITLFFGDSNVEQYSSRIVDLFETGKMKQRGAIFFTQGGCPPIPNIRSKECTNRVNAFLDLAKDPHIDRIVISGHWFGVLSHNLFEANKEEVSRMLADLKRMVQDVSRPGRTIYLVLNIPFGIEVDPISHINRDIFQGGFSAKIIKPLYKSTFIEKNKQAYRALRLIAKQCHLVIIDPLDFLCENNECSALDKMGKAKYMDDFHLRPTYVRNQVSYLDRTVV